MEQAKTIKEVDYEYISKALNLSTEQGFRHFLLKYGDHITEGATNRSIKLENAIIMWLCRAGNCVVNIDGSTYTLSEGQLLFVFAGVYCRFTSISSDFVADVVLARINKMGGSNTLEKSFSKARQLPVLTITKEEDAVISQWIKFVTTSQDNWMGANRLEHDNAILSVLRGELMEMYMRRRYTTREPSAAEKLVVKFENMLATNYLTHRDVEWYANEFHLSPKRFSAKVKRVSGKSPSDLITEEVVKNAKRLLVNSSLSSSEIAERLNFATPSFFCRYFKRYTGMPPQEWRTQNSIM
ncbi:MAG: AraC family transcriptional regulator [Tidjanibacter sp.]|nr:AraC family transcriptional regulator [Tidjanibacter sp.]